MDSIAHAESGSKQGMGLGGCAWGCAESMHGFNHYGSMTGRNNARRSRFVA